MLQAIKLPGAITLIALSLAGCEVVSGPTTGACVTHDNDGGGYWCDEDTDEERCNAEWAATVGLGEDFTLSPDQTCAEIGYGYYCTYDDMAASGGPAYYVARLLSNPSCNASQPAGGTSGGGGGSCRAQNGICGDSTDIDYQSGCENDPDNPGNVFTPGATCPDTGVSCTGGYGTHPVTGKQMQVDFYYPASMCSLIAQCQSVLGGHGAGGC